VIRDPKLLQDLDDRLAAESPVDFAANRRVFEELWRHAVRLGALPPQDPLDGLEVDLRLAEALNVRRTAGPDRPRP
jgi:hypothetical protein